MSFLSAGLLILAFPRLDLSFLAWGGLVPLFFVLDGKKPLAAFRWAFFCGLLFFTGTLFWFFHLTQWFSYIAAIGVLLLFLYLSLYFGLFGLFYSFFSHRKPLQRLFLLPCVWVVLEWVRGNVFTGFGWASLGHSQYKNLFIIQIADITGIFGISFIIVMVNVLLKELIMAYNKTSPSRKALPVLLMAVSLVMIFVLAYGSFRLAPAINSRQPPPRFTAAIIQANTPQEDKWDNQAWPRVVEQYMGLSEQAAGQRPDLMIWPETSYPGFLWKDRELFAKLQAFVRRMEIPLLFGSVLKEGDDYYNAALLLTKDGEIAGIYRKIHLVPFGEFLPLRNIIPFISSLVDIGDFTPGNQWTTFPIDVPHQDSPAEKKFSVLTCFEDTVAGLSRNFSRKGAQLLINMTNDAWFGDTKAPYMHLQTSVFRTVENRRSLIRAANTGASCFIDQWGKIGKCIERGEGNRIKRTYISGYAIGNADFNGKMTFYTKYGDVFTFFCFGCILWGIIRRKKSISINKDINGPKGSEDL